MRHLRVGRKLSRRPDQRRALLRQLMISIILFGRVRTTLARAKEVRRHLEPLVTHARKGDLQHFRLVLSRLGNHKEAARRLFHEIAPSYRDRPGGYLRILKLGVRKGDSAPLALIEWVEGKGERPSRSEEKKGREKEGKEERSRKEKGTQEKDAKVKEGGGEKGKGKGKKGEGRERN
jgi:large subunit ribosomal protein L17